MSELSQERVPTEEQLRTLNKKLSDAYGTVSDIELLQILIDGLSTIRESRPARRFPGLVRRLSTCLGAMFPYCATLSRKERACNWCPLLYRDGCLPDALYSRSRDRDMRTTDMIYLAKKLQDRIRKTPIEKAIEANVAGDARERERQRIAREESARARARRGSVSDIPPPFDGVEQFTAYSIDVNDDSGPNNLYIRLLGAAPERNLSGLRITYNLMYRFCTELQRYVTHRRENGLPPGQTFGLTRYIPMCAINQREYTTFPCESCRIGTVGADSATELRMDCPAEVRDTYSVPRVPATVLGNVRWFLTAIRPFAEAET